LVTLIIATRHNEKAANLLLQKRLAKSLRSYN
jgi:hypothetical protein